MFSVVLFISLIHISQELSLNGTIRTTYPNVKSCEWDNENHTKLEFLYWCVSKHIVSKVLIPDHTVLIEKNKYVYYNYLSFTPSSTQILQFNMNTVRCMNVECLHESTSLSDKIECCSDKFIAGFKSRYKTNYHVYPETDLMTNFFPINYTFETVHINRRIFINYVPLSSWQRFKNKMYYFFSFGKAIVYT